MDPTSFRKYAHQLVDWMADYLENIEQYPVKSAVNPGEIYDSLPEEAPEEAEPFSQIFQDFEEKIIPGITHWQHPAFFAYFNGNSSYPSVLAEMLTATVGAQCMLWETSPAATELEEKIMHWLRTALELPEDFHGVIQDTASTATLCALLTAREKYSHFRINQEGFQDQDFCLYASAETHSSIDKAIRMAGFGQRKLRKIPCDARFAMRAEVLEEKIIQDLEAGKKPLAVVATVGTTSSTALDSLTEIGPICQKYGLFLHVDAAYAGTAALLPEKRHLLEGIEYADSFLFNPHKWMFTNFDCCAFYIKDKEALLKTFAILPEYLKTQQDPHVNNYRDWGIALGRRFRALKLWFVIRSYGLSGIREKLRLHIRLANYLKEKIETHPDFEMMAPMPLNVLCFRFKPSNLQEESVIEELNKRLLQALNQSGQVYLSPTRLEGRFTLRAAIGQTQVSEKQVQTLWELMQQLSRSLVA